MSEEEELDYDLVENKRRRIQKKRKRMFIHCRERVVVKISNLKGLMKCCSNVGTGEKIEIFAIRKERQQIKIKKNAVYPFNFS